MNTIVSQKAARFYFGWIVTQVPNAFIDGKMFYGNQAKTVPVLSHKKRV